MDRKSQPRKQRHTAHLTLRTDDASLSAWREASLLAAYPSVSAWSREALSRAACDSARRAPPRWPDAELARQIGLIGNNLNQIARRVNASRHPERLRILVGLMAIREQLAELANDGCT